MKKSLVFLLVLGLAAVILAACNSARSGTPAPAAPTAETKAGVYPAPQTSAGAYPYPYPYPLPAAQAVQPTRDPSYPGPDPTPTYDIKYVVPEVTADKGVVIGRLINIETGEPFAYHAVYLGFKIPLTPGPAFNYGLQEQSSPHTITDEQGRFALGNVDPGSYIVILFHPSAISVVMVPNSDQELDVVVTAGQLLDLGEMSALPPFR